MSWICRNNYHLCKINKSDTFFPFFANNVAKELDVVVLPTPPLPPTKIHFNVLLSRIFYKVASIYYIIKF